MLARCLRGGRVGDSMNVEWKKIILLLPGTDSNPIWESSLLSHHPCQERKEWATHFVEGLRTKSLRSRWKGPPAVYLSWMSPMVWFLKLPFSSCHLWRFRTKRREKPRTANFLRYVQFIAA